MKRTWEYRIYKDQMAYDARIQTVIEDGLNRKTDWIYECKHTLKKLKFEAPIVKIQSSDREVIETYHPVNQFGNIIFKR